MTTSFQPAFEVTHVKSMQWNRSWVSNSGGNMPTHAVAPLSPEVLARVQQAVKSETAHAVR